MSFIDKLKRLSGTLIQALLTIPTQDCNSHVFPSFHFQAPYLRIIHPPTLQIVSITLGLIIFEHQLQSSPPLSLLTAPPLIITGPRTNVWQSVFNPGHNFNPKAHGKDYYDSPTSDNKTTWDFHIDSQKKKDEQATPDPNISKPVGGGEKMMDISKVESLLKSSRSGDGRVDVDEFIAKLKSQG
jgi:hypothetical protein